MRGKVIVGIMLLMALVMLVAQVWFLSSQPPVDMRFNQRRQAITNEIAPFSLLPPKVGDFVGKALTPIGPNANNQLEGSATYADTDNKAIMLSVRQLSAPTLDTLTDSTFQIHKDSKFPYAYKGDSSSGYIFVWINGEWAILASTKESDAEALIQFVNGYPF